MLATCFFTHSLNVSDGDSEEELENDDMPPQVDLPGEPEDELRLQIEQEDAAFQDLFEQGWVLKEGGEREAGERGTGERGKTEREFGVGGSCRRRCWCATVACCCSC